MAHRVDEILLQISNSKMRESTDVEKTLTYLSKHLNKPWVNYNVSEVIKMYQQNNNEEKQIKTHVAI